MSLSIKKEMTSLLSEDVQEVAVNLMSVLTIKTPVDTGVARYNWQVSIGNTEDSTLEYSGAPGSAGGRAMSREMPTMLSINLGQIVWAQNNLPYIERLNNGWSEQAPVNFVEEAMRVAVRGN